MTIREQDLTVSAVVHRPSYDFSRVYWDVYLTASAWVGVPRVMEPDKCEGLEYHPVDALPDDTIDYVRTVVGRTLLAKGDRSGDPVFVETGWLE